MPTDLLQRGDEWLAGQRRDWMSRPVEYSPVGSDEPISVRATVGRTDVSTLEEGGMTIESQLRDWIVPRSDLTTAPQRGDRIRETNGGREYVYEVMSPVGGMPVWDWADQSYTAYRIHTRFVLGEDVE